MFYFLFDKDSQDKDGFGYHLGHYNPNGEWVAAARYKRLKDVIRVVSELNNEKSVVKTKHNVKTILLQKSASVDWGDYYG